MCQTRCRGRGAEAGAAPVPSRAGQGGTRAPSFVTMDAKVPPETPEGPTALGCDHSGEWCLGRSRAEYFERHPVGGWVERGGLGKASWRFR